MRRVVILLLFGCGVSMAQSINAALWGVVLDPQGLVVQGAEVVVVNKGTNERLKLLTDVRGGFRIPSIPTGEYTVTAAAPGFSRLVFESVPLTVGQSRSLTMELQPESGKQEITVTAEGVSDLNLDAGGTGKTFNALEMNDLPNLSGGQGRNFRTQVFLTPAVTPTYAAHRPFAVAGARSRNNSYQIDSNDYNEVEGGLLMGRGTSEQLVSVEALEGMQVLTHNYKAEYGRNNGAIVSMVTKRGSNEWHGSAYEYLRNEALSARNTFDLARPPLKTHQAGATLGGPLRKDTSYLFGNFETYVRRASAVSTVQTLTPGQKAQAAPSVQPLAAMYPDPNLPGTNLFRSNVGQNGSLHTFLVRADHNLSSNQRLFARSLYLDTYTETTAGAALSRGHRDIGSQSHSAHHSWSPSAEVLNEARFQFTRFKILDAFDDPLQLGDPAVNGEVGQVVTSGLSSLGHFSFMAQRSFQNSFQWSDDFSVRRGGHALKMGVAARRQQLNNGRFNNAFVGQLRFLSIADFLGGRPVAYSRNVGNPFAGLRSTEFNTYFQDDWQIHPRLTLNLGVRYELNTVPYEVNGLIEQRYRFHGDRNNVAPRISLAWRADRAGKTVVRGGYGIHYNLLELSFIGLTRFNPPLIQNLVAARPELPNLLANAQAAIPSGLVIPDANVRTPYAQHFTLRVERELFGPGIVAGLGYLGTAGVKLPRNALPNGGDGLPQEQRPDTSVGVINNLRTDTTSRYDAVEASLSWRRSGFSLRTTYTFGKSLDTVSDYPSSNTGIERTILPIDETNLRLNRGPSDFDTRHLLNVFYTYDLPVFRKNRWLGGWQVLGIANVTSGRPYTLFSGTDNPAGSNSNRILNIPGSLVRLGGSNREAIRLAEGFTAQQLTPAGGALGNIGRNTERAAGVVQFNVSLGKSFRVRERAQLQFRAETFNLFNKVNYDLPDGLLGSRNFGQAVSALDSRQMQLGLKVTF
ncbi:MAG: TonB-dependent receptor [Bryobacteraceae bacterium]